jgi:hypothetical protein
LRRKLLSQQCSNQIYNHELQPGQLIHREKGCVIKARVWKKKTLCALATTGQHQRRKKKKPRGNKHGKLLTIWRGTRRLVESSHCARILRCPSRSAVSTGSCPRRNRQWIVSWRHSYKYLEYDEWAEYEP